MRYATLAAIATCVLLAGSGCLRPSTDPVPAPVQGGSSDPAPAVDGTGAAGSIPSDAELDALAKQERRVWRYDDGIRHVYSREGGKGRFFQIDGAKWKHRIEMFPDDAKDFEEIVRTDEYVELKDWTGTQIYRLYDDRFESRPSHVAEFSTIGPGRWALQIDPREIAQVVAARTWWRYENAPVIFPDQGGVVAGSFRREPSGAWKEERVGGTDGPRDWVEKERTDEYVEIARPDGGFFVRLYADRSEYRYGNESAYKPMFPGKWIGDANDPAAGGS